MINLKIFLKGLKANIGVRSPAIPLAACFIALGALLKDAGLNLQQSIASSFFTYALPGQLVMAESLVLGASLINIFIADDTSNCPEHLLICNFIFSCCSAISNKRLCSTSHKCMKQQNEQFNNKS